MKKMSNIRKGRLVFVISAVLAFLLYLASTIAKDIHKNNVVQNLQGTDKFLYEMGRYDVPDPDCVLVMLIGCVICLLVGTIVASSLCKCPNCGYHLMSRHGGIPNHCPYCGKKIKY